jgi:hypothetical protein
MLPVLVVLLVLDIGGRFTASDVLSVREVGVVKSTSEPVTSSHITATSPGGARDASTEGVVVIQGIFDASGEKLLELKPVQRYAYHSRTIPGQREGRFVVTVTFMSGTATAVPFDALIADDAGRMVHGFFEVVIPVTDGIASICITDASGRKTFACVDGSKIPK